MGDRAFCSAAPSLWNALPDHLRTPQSVDAFKFLSSSTIKSVLASIGYLPHADTPQSEFRLSEDANPERAMLLGFELLLARVECYHFLELVEKDQLGQQEWMEVLQRRVGPIKLEEDIENKITGLKEEEKDKMKKEEADKKELPLYLGTRLTMKPQPKPQQCHLISVDQSIMEMQITYPDLAFRGRPLIPDKPHSANSSRSTSKDDHIATDNHSDDGKVAGPPKRDCIKGTKAAASTAYRKNDGSKDDEVFVDNGSDYRTSGGTTTLGTTATGSFSNGDRSRLDDELNGPQALSLHITLRAGSTAGQSLKTGEQQAAADEQTKVELSSLSSLEEQQELKELSERMGQLCMQETKEEVKRKEENKKEEKANEEKERKVSTEREAEEQNLRKPVMETGSVVSHGANRCAKSFQHDSATMKGPKQPNMCHSSPVTVRAADCECCKGEGSMGQEGEETGRGEEEQLAQSFVIVEPHKK
ncbi:uncharacterized protein LOC113131454 isoform X2 [Mastacembelus armatus]|uniref:uncharacterized protein LOC113131454 isoform X2 n=1 Tax=Mastacembelus armatus TaxID=205130 RepID=UPI000E45AAC8|nr:uncharacterized protein LOC113131454 isoform X2 [Mastacembelus armatus]